MLLLTYFLTCLDVKKVAWTCRAFWSVHVRVGRVRQPVVIRRQILLPSQELATSRCLCRAEELRSDTTTQTNTHMEEWQSQRKLVHIRMNNHTIQPATKSNPNPNHNRNPTTKQHDIVSI